MSTENPTGRASRKRVVEKMPEEHKEILRLTREWLRQPTDVLRLEKLASALIAHEIRERLSIRIK